MDTADDINEELCDRKLGKDFVLGIYISWKIYPLHYSVVLVIIVHDVCAIKTLLNCQEMLTVWYYSF